MAGRSGNFSLIGHQLNVLSSVLIWSSGGLPLLSKHHHDHVLSRLLFSHQLTDAGFRSSAAIQESQNGGKCPRRNSSLLRKLDPAPTHQFRDNSIPGQLC